MLHSFPVPNLLLHRLCPQQGFSCAWELLGSWELWQQQENWLAWVPMAGAAWGFEKFHSHASPPPLLASELGMSPGTWPLHHRPCSKDDRLPAVFL